MNVFHIDSSTGEFVGQSVADESPLEPGVYLIPAHATEIAPPISVPAGSVAVFSGTSWSVVEDHRGEKYWLIDGTEIVMDVLGPLPDGASLTAPPPNLADIKAAKMQQINGWRVAANTSSFVWQGKNISVDSLSRSDIDGIAGYVALNNALPADFPGVWKALDNTLIPMTDVATFKDMYAAMVAAGNANYVRSQQLKAAVDNATDIATVEALTW